MNNIFILVLCICFIVSTHSRLLERITAKTFTTKAKTNKIRLSRQIEDIDTFAGISREDNARSDEFLNYYNNKVEQLNKLKLIKYDSHVRKTRESGEHHSKPTKNLTTPPARKLVTQTKTKPVVKKPIPKYNEMEYDEDFQMKINKSPMAFIDSGEHEDEDFNLNDYDFDINHDEFIGRGKPLEPRLKYKEYYVPVKPVPKPVLNPMTQIKTKVNVPASNQPISNKKERSVKIPKKGGEDDYYEDITSTKAPIKPRDLDDDFNDDNDESKDYDRKDSTIRHIRSPWNMNSYSDRFGDKSYTFKMLSSLPMFPQIPGEERDFRFNIGHGYHKNWQNKAMKR